MGRMGMFQAKLNMGVSKNSGTPKSSILIGFSIINHAFWVPLFLETPIRRNMLKFVHCFVLFLGIG